jgi:hypothetical protein
VLLLTAALMCSAIFTFAVSLTKSHFMRKMLPFLAGLLLSLFATAQAYEDKIEYDKKKQPAFVIEFSYPPEAVENAVIAKMQKMGYKGKEEKGLFNKDKGFRIYKNAFISEISDKKYDYVVQVERKSRKEKDEAVLHFIILDGDVNAISAFNGEEMRNAKSFLNDLLPEVEEANLELEIRAQEELLSKAEKKLKTLESDKSDMESKIKKLESDLESNERTQEDTRKDIENQRNLLESLKIKRRV